jgi:hypothetical protein
MSTTNSMSVNMLPHTTSTHNIEELTQLCYRAALYPHFYSFFLTIAQTISYSHTCFKANENYFDLFSSVLLTFWSVFRLILIEGICFSAHRCP